MKKIKVFFIMITVMIIIIAIVSWARSDSVSCVTICDYKNITIDSDFVEVSKEDIDAVINMDFSVNDYFVSAEKGIIETGDIVKIELSSEEDEFNLGTIYYEVGSASISYDLDNFLIGKTLGAFNFYIDKSEITVNVMDILMLPNSKDENTVLNFYGMETMDEVNAYLTGRIRDEIIYNYMWDYILENSVIESYPDELNEIIEETLKEIQSSAEEIGMSLEDYLEEIKLTENDIKQNISSNYFEEIIKDEILKMEGVTILEEDVYKMLERLKIEYGYTDDEIGELYSYDDVYYMVADEKIRTILISYAIILY